MPRRRGRFYPLLDQTIARIARQGALPREPEPYVAIMRAEARRLREWRAGRRRLSRRNAEACVLRFLMSAVIGSEIARARRRAMEPRP